MAEDPRGSFVSAVEDMMNHSYVNILKELYGDQIPEYYHVEGAKEELLRRIKELPKVEKMLYGISEDGESIYE